MIISQRSAAVVAVVGGLGMGVAGCGTKSVTKAGGSLAKTGKSGLTKGSKAATGAAGGATGAVTGTSKKGAKGMLHGKKAVAGIAAGGAGAVAGHHMLKGKKGSAAAGTSTAKGAGFSVGKSQYKVGSSCSVKPAKEAFYKQHGYTCPTSSKRLTKA